MGALGAIEAAGASCCGAAAFDARAGGPASGSLARFVARTGAGEAGIAFAVANMQCGACVHAIERVLSGLPGVTAARANLTARRVDLRFDPERFDAARAATALAKLGYDTRPQEPGGDDVANVAEERELLKALAVAGFAAANVMLLSVSVWSGLFSGDMSEATRNLMHWISAGIALPAVAYAGRPFFGSALEAVRAGRVNMDVPIALAVLLAAGMSLFETMQGGREAYFDAAVSLLFFLLIGRYLERRARARARSAADELARLAAPLATRLRGCGHRDVVPVADLRRGDRLEVLPGDLVPADGSVQAGQSLVDESFLTGEPLPAAAAPGTRLRAGTVNLESRIELSVEATGETTVLARMVRLLREAEQGRNRYVRLADRLARWYAPGVHAIAAATFLGWLAAGADWQNALLIAVAVLIVTCPCALGLAVPVTQVVAAGRLFERGILIKSADTLERLAEVDTVVFDKTGTLSDGDLTFIDEGQVAADRMLAARLALASRHPLSRALARLVPDATPYPRVEEVPGQGLRGLDDGGEVRLGRASWCGAGPSAGAGDRETAAGPEVWLRRADGRTIAFRFTDRLRPDAAAVLDGLRRRGLGRLLLSGDRPGAVAASTRGLALESAEGGLEPEAKAARIRDLAGRGRRVLMVGDGINDAPSLAFAHVSMAPAEGAEIAQGRADVVFRGGRLAPVLESLDTAGRARTIMLQNFALALGYNLCAVPLAASGMITPMFAAIAMSSSSLLVTLNALRLRFAGSVERKAAS